MRGRRQRGNSMPRAAKTAKPGELIATGLRLDGAEYTKAHIAAAAAGLSLSGYIAALVRQDQVDENGRPLWADPGPEQLTATADDPAAR
ncbi:MAG: hypothetical protein ACJ72W_30110 [Actinoallomurus sp.]